MEVFSDFKKSILIVEDEVLIARQLKEAILQHGYDCAGIAINYESAKEILDTTKVDLVLLDIKISGKKTGLDFAQLLNLNYGLPFLFITSYNDEATLSEIKKLSPRGYINKPINEVTILTTIDIVFNNLEGKTQKNINITIGSTTYNINLNELFYVSSEHVYIRLYFSNRTVLIRSSLSSFLSLLPNNSLVRVNRSTAVNVKLIENVSTNEVKIQDETIKISSNYKDDFFKSFNFVFENSSS